MEKKLCFHKILEKVLTQLLCEVLGSFLCFRNAQRKDSLYSEDSWKIHLAHQQAKKNKLIRQLKNIALNKFKDAGISCKTYYHYIQKLTSSSFNESPFNATLMIVGEPFEICIYTSFNHCLMKISRI